MWCLNQSAAVIVITKIAILSYVSPRQERSVCLCSVRGGEVLGDLEVVMKLTTHMYTVTSTSPTTVFLLDYKNLDRLVGKRNQVTMERIKQTALVSHNVGVYQ